jgi:dTDP-4-dehydrorhamnose 3,5-epimerase-like enzyme
MRGVKIERLRGHRDPRGTVFEPLTAAMLRRGTIVNVHVATMRPGAVRGNHRHLVATEYVCFSGPIKLVVQDQKGRQEQIQFRESECVRLKIGPRVAHAFVNTGAYDTFIVCFVDRTGPGDKKERVPLISEIGHC